MNDYTPTDEQIEALCTAEAALFMGDEDYLATKAFIAHPAFQSIIRAAQAEALRDYAGRVSSPGSRQAMLQLADRIESADV